MNEEEYKVVDCMAKFGGSFVKSLAECFYRADRGNFMKLRVAFDNYWVEYEKMSQKENGTESTKSL